MAKTLVVAGVCLVVAGVLWHFGVFSWLRLGRLPGDIAIEREGFRFYFPLTTCILISLIFMGISWLFRR